MAPREAKRPDDFDRRLWTRFWRVAKPFWFGSQRWRARGMLLLLVVLLAARTQITVIFNHQSGEFTSALVAKDHERFWSSVRYFGAVLLAAVPTYALYFWVRDFLGIEWRRWATAHYVRRYMNNRAYYRLGWQTDIDNPDQRIVGDIGSFTQRSLVFLLDIVGSLLELVAFSGVLWSISRGLVAFLIAYAAIGTWVTFGVFGKPMIGLNFQHIRREADLRFSLIRVREHAEPIAFYGGEEHETEQVMARLSAMYDNYRRLLKRTFGLNLFQYLYGFITLVVPSMIVAPRIIAGELEVGQAVQASGAFAAMLSALTVFVEKFESLSTFAAGIERVHAFDRAVRKKRAPAPGSTRIRRAAASHVTIRDLELATPSREQVLLRDLRLDLAPGQSLLIMGASGGGKSSILRAIAGLWEEGSGEIESPDSSSALFLPQRPYMVMGTLRDQLLYPRRPPDASDEALQAALERVNLPNLSQRCGGLDGELDFAKRLSTGEQQRLAFARVLLSNAELIVLDEATSALDPANEALLYRELKRRPAIVISVAHRRALVGFHDKVLLLDGATGWKLLSASEYISLSEERVPT